MTIDAIADAVTRELQTEAGIKRVQEMDKLVDDLNDKDLRRVGATLRIRPGISFSVNTTQARNDRRRISVRAHGVDCGFVSFGQAGRMFTRSKKFVDHWTSKERSLEWREPEVRRFIEECERDARKKFWPRESRIQELLFRQMYGGGKTKTGPLRDFQPVLFGGVPIQLPSPAAPRGSSEKLKRKGHSDLVARSREPGWLVIFEIKREAASARECIGALAQAIRYAAALDYLMSRKEHRAAYWRLLGSQRGPHHVPRFSAVAFLSERASKRCEEDLRATLEELRAKNRKEYKLSVMLYRVVGDDIEVVRFPDDTSVSHSDLELTSARRA